MPKKELRIEIDLREAINKLLTEEVDNAATLLSRHLVEMITQGQDEVEALVRLHCAFVQALLVPTENPVQEYMSAATLQQSGEIMLRARERAREALSDTAPG